MPDFPHHPLERLAAEWDACSHAPEAAAAMHRLAAAEPSLAALGVRDLGDLVHRLRDARTPTEREAAAAAVRAMLRSGGVDPMVPRAVVQALLPGLVSVGRRLSWGAGGDFEDPGAFFAELVSTTWELVVAWSGEDRPYAVLDILSAVRCRARRQVVRQRVAHQQVVLGLDAARVEHVPWRRGTTDLDELARAIDDLADGGADRADVAVLYAHRVLGYSISELSRLTGRSRRLLGRHRDRAARVLTA